MTLIINFNANIKPKELTDLIKRGNLQQMRKRGWNHQQEPNMILGAYGLCHWYTLQSINDLTKPPSPFGYF